MHPERADDPTSVILLRLEGQEYALPLGCVVEVVRMAALAQVPDAPAHVLDLLRRLGLAPAEPGLSTPICVVEAGGRGFGLVADAVTDVRPLAGPVDRLADASEDGPVAGVAHVDGRLVPVLDPARPAGPAPPVRPEPAGAGR
jgi:chemotaxis signal transduction protein